MHSIGPQRLHNKIFFQALLEAFSTLRSIAIVIAYEKIWEQTGCIMAVDFEVSTKFR